MTTIKNEDEFKRLMYMSAIPKEMFWAYMAVQQSSIWNMMCILHQINDDPKEMMQAMDKAYIKFVTYTNTDITKDEYVHITRDHIKLMQYLYNDLYKAYGKDYPKGIVNIKVKRDVEISI